MTSEEVQSLLRAMNPRTTEGRIRMYADAFLEYRKAQANIAEHGTIVQHPRTGQPITNPYLAIRDAAARTMRELKLDDAAIWP